MIEKPADRDQRQTRGRLPVGRTTAARCAAVATFFAMILTVTSASAVGASGPLASAMGVSGGAGNGSEALLAPLRQFTAAAAPEPPTNSGATLDASRMAAIMTVVTRQGVQGPETLKRLSGVAVSNLVVEPALVVDARAKRVAEAEAAATEIALTVQATVEAQEAEAASRAAELAAIQEREEEADAAASATAAAMATETARDSAAEAAAMSAKQEAGVRAAELAATRNVATLAATAVVSDPVAPNRMSSLLIALVPLLGGVLGLRLWRTRKEPFVLKANPIPTASSAAA